MMVDLVAFDDRIGEVRAVRGPVAVSGLEITSSRVRDGCVEIDFAVERVVEGFVVRGRLAATVDGECRRCLGPVTAPLEITVREIFELDPTDGETWPIADDHIDLEPLVRESMLLALPLAPLCRDDCAGPQPDRFPTGAAAAPSDAEVGRDSRWAALDELRPFDE